MTTASGWTYALASIWAPGHRGHTPAWRDDRNAWYRGWHAGAHRDRADQLEPRRLLDVARRRRPRAAGRTGWIDPAGDGRCRRPAAGRDREGRRRHPRPLGRAEQGEVGPDGSARAVADRGDVRARRAAARARRRRRRAERSRPTAAAARSAGPRRPRRPASRPGGDRRDGGRDDRDRRGRGRSERAWRPSGSARSGAPDRSGDRPDEERRRHRPHFTPPPELPQRPKPKRLRPGKQHRIDVLASLPEEQRPVAELAQQGMPAVRQRLREDNARLRAEGKPPMPEAGVLKMAEELIPRLRVADWLDRAEAAQRQLAHLDLRDLRSVVASADDPVVARDESTRALAVELKQALVTKQDEEQALWLADVEAALDVGRIVRALRLSSVPPKAGVPFPPSLAHRLGGGDARRRCSRRDGPDRWAAVLEAAAFSPVRALVVPAAPAEQRSDELMATVRRLAPLLPQVAAIYGIEVAARRADAQAAAPDEPAPGAEEGRPTPRAPRPARAAAPPAEPAAQPAEPQRARERRAQPQPSPSRTMRDAVTSRGAAPSRAAAERDAPPRPPRRARAAAERRRDEPPRPPRRASPSRSEPNDGRPSRARRSLRARAAGRPDDTSAEPPSRRARAVAEPPSATTPAEPTDAPSPSRSTSRPTSHTAERTSRRARPARQRLTHRREVSDRGRRRAHRSPRRPDSARDAVSSSLGATAAHRSPSAARD